MKYEEYKTELEKVTDPTQKLMLNLLMDIRHAVNNIDKHLKGKTSQRHTNVN